MTNVRLVVALLTVAAGLVTTGFAVLHPAAGFIAAGVLLAGGTVGVVADWPDR